MIFKKINFTYKMNTIMNCAVKRNNSRNSIFNLVNDVFNNDIMMYKRNLKPTRRPMNAINVNILDSDNNYQIDLAAPGLSKKDFNIEIDDKVLTISYETKKEELEEKKEDSNVRFIRKEFNNVDFKKSFNLEDENINTDAIEASYNQGILSVVLPKTEVVKPEKKTIKVA